MRSHVYGRTPTGCSPSRRARPATTAVHATHLTDADIALLGAHRHRVCLCPTTERDLADGIGPAGALRRRRRPARLGSDQHAVIDLFEEARAVELHERLAAGRAGALRPRRPAAAAADRARTASGWPDAGQHRARARADLVAVRLDTPRTAGADPAQVVFAATRRRRRHRRRRRAGAWSTAASIVLGDVGALLADAIAGHLDRRRVVTDHDDAPRWSPASASWSPTTRGTARRSASWPTPPSWSRTAASPGSAPAATAPAADRRTDVGGRGGHPRLRRLATPTWSSPATGPPSSTPGWRASPYDGGGIATTVAATRAASDDELRGLLRARSSPRCARQGTTTVEIKSGYGLTVDDEAALLRLAGEVTAETTFLGAHVVPPGARPGATTSRWSPARCSPPARRTPGGSTCSASRPAPTRSTATRPARC